MERISFDDVVAFNNKLCSDDNKQSIIINKNNIESALSVQDSYYETDEQIACALFRSLIIAHGFEDGNKRTATLILKFMLQPSCSDKELCDIAIDVAQNSNYQIDDLVNKIYG